MSDREPKKLPTWLLLIVILTALVLGLLMLVAVVLVVGFGLLAYSCSTH